MPSRTIRPTQAPAAAPFAYTVGAADGLAPQAVSAQWDGTGAGGDFLPCVSYYSAEGVLLDRAFPTTGPIAAGDTAEVSYRPFDRGGGGGGTPTPALITLNGVVTVNPTAQLRIGPHMTLVDNGGGEAAIDALGQAAAIYAIAQSAAPGVWPGDGVAIPLAPIASHGVTIASTTWTIVTAGVYDIVAVAQSFAIDGPAGVGGGASPELVLSWQISGANELSDWFFPLSIPFGITWSISPMMQVRQPLVVGDTIKFRVFHQLGTPNLGMLKVSILKVGP